MSLSTYVIRKLLNLKDPEYGKTLVEKNIKIPMRDGVYLKGDRYYPKERPGGPLVLIRSFYGRKGFFGLVFGKVIAEQGFQVLLQCCRGTYDSEGELLPLLTEKDDGTDTIKWLKEQDWYPGSFATTGPSYLGYVQWAIAGEAGEDLKAMALQITASNFRGMGFPGDSFALNTALTWMYLVNNLQSDFHSAKAFLTMFNKRRKAFRQLPLKELDHAMLKRQVDFWQLLLVMGDSHDEGISVADYSSVIPDLNAPVSMQGGWYDIFLPWMIKDFTTLQEAGKNPRIIVGPWTHINIPGGATGLKDAIEWLRLHLLNDKSGLRKYPVKLFIMGANDWRHYKNWPPENAISQKWYLMANKKLSRFKPEESEPDSYIYDPADPTPSVGGATLFELTGYRDNRKLEKRKDVLVYESEILEKSLEISGPVITEIFISSNLECTDFFVRLCDVYPSGKSINLCDGLRRLRPNLPAGEPDGTRKVIIEMWPTAAFFRRGHRIRLQVSSGAHPRFARNPGCNESLAGAAELLTAQQKIYHDPEHPSAIILPVVERDDSGTLHDLPARCIWCNDDDGIFKEFEKNRETTFLPQEENRITAVHPKHESAALNYLAKAEKYGKFLLTILILNLLLTFAGMASEIMGFLIDSYGAVILWIFVGPFVIVFSLVLIAFPYAGSGKMIVSGGMRRGIILVRILATGTLITAFSQLI